MREDACHGHCPKCGRFCSDIVGYINGIGLQRVEGICGKHGLVDLTHEDWVYEDFDDEKITPKEVGR